MALTLQISQLEAGLEVEDLQVLEEGWGQARDFLWEMVLLSLCKIVHLAAIKP
jgi:hypothetical protein